MTRRGEIEPVADGKSAAVAHLTCEPARRSLMAISVRRPVTILCGAVVFGITIAASPGVAFAQVGPAVTINPTGTFDVQSGMATITGTFDCGDTTGAERVEVSLSQRVGRVSTVAGEGFFDIPGTCAPGKTGDWVAPVTPSSGKFRGGKAFASARLDTAETGRTVQLS
jgi:hypothetical protein